MRAVFLRFAEDWISLWRRPDRTLFDQLHAADFVDHAAAGRAADRDAFWGGIVALFEAFPDFNAVVDDAVADADAGKLAIRWSATGTHRGPFMGAAPTGRVVKFRGIEIVSIADGRVVERWGEWNGEEIREQLGRGD